MDIYISSIQAASTTMMIVAAIIAVGIIFVSGLFLAKSIKRANKIGMDKKIIKNAIRNSAIFSIVPSIPIVIGVAVMATMLLNVLGIPWIRLTVIGALQYEITIAGLVGGEASVLSEKAVATAFIIMTVAIMSGPLFNVFVFKKYQGKLSYIRDNNKKLLDTITGALLGGLLAGIVSYMIISGFNSLITGKNTVNTDGSTTIGAVTLLTLASSVIIMVICGILMKVFKWKWMENYALPLTMLGALALAMLFQSLFSGKVDVQSIVQAIKGGIVI